MLRVHFGAEDLLHTRFAPAPAPLMDLGMAVAALQRREPLFDRWRRDARPKLSRAARQLTQLVPPTAAGPVFLDPVSDDLYDGLAAVLSSTRTTVRRELLRVFAAGGPITPWVRALDERDRDAWQLLANAVVDGHKTLIAPSWQRIRRSHSIDIAWRGRVTAEFGLQGVLESLHPSGRWRGLTLEFDVDSGLSVYPDGHGVTLLPSAFWTGRPMIATHPDGSTLIVYPALTPLPLVDEPTAGDPLADLLGRTRAAVLTLAVNPCTTGQLARGLGISAASASEHARTLRNAGLLVTERAGKAVLHSLTLLGDRLLAGGGRLPEVAQASPPTVPISAAATSSRW